VDFVHENTRTVASSTTEYADYTPANGEKLFLIELGGCAAVSADVKVEILWDTERWFVTHGALHRPCKHDIVGDGTKKLRLKFVNDSGTGESLSAWIIGEKYV